MAKGHKKVRRKYNPSRNVAAFDAAFKAASKYRRTPQYQPLPGGAALPATPVYLERVPEDEEQR